jgi:hypothetical protein
LVNELKQSFGVSELGQLPRDNELSTRYWSSGWKHAVVAWAEKGGSAVDAASPTAATAVT